MPDRLQEALQLHNAGRLEEAAAAYREAIQAQPDNPATWANLGTILREQGHFEAALVCAKRALVLRPSDPGYLTNLGNVYTDLDREHDALAAHARAVELAPRDFLARKNYANALREFGHFAQALHHYERALRIQPDNDGIKWDRTTTLLYLGDFKNGWASFYTRWKMPEAAKPVVRATPWNGHDLTGKTLMVHGEQGFGDTILCARYLPLLKERGGRVILECKKPLHKLFSAIPGVDLIVEPGKCEESFDYQIPIMSLPVVFKTDLSSIPPIPPLNVPDKPPKDAARLLKASGDDFKVGIVWSGSVTFKGNRKRAVSIDRFIPLAGIEGVQLYSLQKGPCEPQLYEAGADALIWDLAPSLNDFTDTAAILRKLDLVIMTDSSVAHLAGSIGTPVWNLLNYRPYWLYLSHREDCPWYPSMRLIRQPSPGDWDSVFDRVTSELARAVALKAAGQWPKAVKAKQTLKVAA